MPHILQQIYRGWEITIRCNARTEAGHPNKYTAVAEATLLPGEDPSAWVDPRVQVLSTGGRCYSSDQECVALLLSEAKQLIDALRR
ncbi:hypothetical protein FHW83_003360 [Duganella sp. SG902]|uniref:hypothetical protein n=1 Tax=Duganella sp. SG902 TaxID=2587016 RepID=UPI00159D93CD|nr:hypothetical protein [Duganella sp. SG902]NVM77542.1 hypothetical protein [Duganella sp. SG902]